MSTHQNPHRVTVGSGTVSLMRDRSFSAYCFWRSHSTASAPRSQPLFASPGPKRSPRDNSSSRTEDVFLAGSVYLICHGGMRRGCWLRRITDTTRNTAYPTCPPVVDAINIALLWCTLFRVSAWTRDSQFGITAYECATQYSNL